MLTQKILKELLHYNHETGLFVWVKCRQGVTVGMRAGVFTNGYYQIKIDGKSYLAHRLAWLYVYGYLPEKMLDHIDRERGHNSISNLREVSRSCNHRNTSPSKNNKSGVKGVYYHKGDGKFYANITVHGKQTYLCSKDNLLESSCHRLAAEQAEDWAGCDSSSPAYQYVKKHIPTIT